MKLLPPPTTHPCPLLPPPGLPRCLASLTTTCPFVVPPRHLPAPMRSPSVSVLQPESCPPYGHALGLDGSLSKTGVSQMVTDLRDCIWQSNSTLASESEEKPHWKANGMVFCVLPNPIPLTILNNLFEQLPRKSCYICGYLISP